MVMTRARELRHVTPPETTRRPAIIALVLGREGKARIEEALGAEYSLTFVSTLDAARSALSRFAEAVLIVEPSDERGTPTAPFVRQLIAARCDLPVIGYCSIPRDDTGGVVDLSRAGVHELLFRNATDSTLQIRQTLHSAVRAWAGAAIFRRVADGLPGQLRAVVRYCLYYPTRATSVGAVANAIGIDRKTIANRCARAGLPVPGAVIGWCRLLIAAHLLRSQLSTVEAVALQLDFPSATSFRNMFKRYTGMRPADVREEAGMQRMMEMFEAALHVEKAPAMPEVPEQALRQQ